MRLVTRTPKKRFILSLSFPLSLIPFPHKFFAIFYAFILFLLLSDNRRTATVRLRYETRARRSDVRRAPDLFSRD